MKGITKSSLYLIDLAPFSFKANTEGRTITQAIVKQQFDNLYKVLECLSTSNSSDVASPYAESYLTRVLKDLLAPKNHIAIIGHIVQEEGAYVETMGTLMYLQKCKALAGHANKGEGEAMSAAARDRLLRKINQENNDLKTKLEQIKRTHSKQLDELRQMLGLELDLEQIASRRVFLKEMEILNEHKKAVEEGDALEKRNHELEEKLDRCNQKLKELHKEYDELQEKRSCEYLMLQEDIARFKAEIREYKQKIANSEKYYDKVKEKQVELVEQSAKQMLDEKTIIVGSVKSILKAKEEMAKNTQTLRLSQSNREERLYNNMERINTKNYDMEKDQLVAKYNKLIENQRKEYEKYVALYQKFRRNKKYLSM